MSGSMSQLSNAQVTKAKKHIKKQLYICFLGIFFSFSAFRAVFDLQTSINIQHGIGSTSGFVIGGTTILASFTISPLILKRLGPIKSLVLCEVFFLIFVIANFYAVLGTMIPASLLSGVAEALVFPALSVMCFHCAIQCSKLSSEKRVQHYIHDFAGKCFGIVYLTRVSGNLISYAVMRTGSSMLSSSNSSAVSNDASGAATLEYCGARDCQDPNITKANLSTYVSSRSTIYILLSIFLVLIVISIIIHYFAIDEIQPLSARDANENVLQLIEDNFKEDADSMQSNQSDTPDPNTNNPNCYKSQILDTLANCLHQLKTPKQLLLSSIQLYAGLQLTFMASEVTRAYVSCMRGVEQVGLAMLVFGSAGCLSSYFSGILAGRIGRNIPILSAFLMDMTVYIFCLLWVPNESTTWLTFAVAAALGYGSGIWQSLTNAMVAKYFKTNQEVAYTMWNMFFSSGITIQFGWSPYLCVRTKLYITAIFLCFAMVLYGVAEYKYHWKPKIGDRETKNITVTDPT